MAPRKAGKGLWMEKVGSGLWRLRWEADGAPRPSLSGLPGRATGEGDKDFKLSLEKGMLRLCSGDQVLFTSPGRAQPRPRTAPFPSQRLAHEPLGPEAPPAEGGAAWDLDLAPGTRLFGLGEKGGPMERTGRRYEDWNTDAYRHTPVTDPLYKSIPFLLAYAAPRSPGPSGLWWGLVLDNPSRCHWDLGFTQLGRLSWRSAEGGLDAWLLAGPGPQEVLRRLAQLSGKPFMPPLWSLGVHLSRWGWESSGEVQDQGARSHAEGLPLDCLHLDIGHMEGHKPFTWGPGFKDAPSLHRRLAQAGLRTVAIVDPGLKADPAYGPYRQGLKGRRFVSDEGGAAVLGKVWSGVSAFPDFMDPRVRAWWGPLHGPLLKAGVSGIWCDMNEPALFEGGSLAAGRHRTPKGRIGHLACHNLYGHMMARAAAEGLAKARPRERGFVLTRSAYLGTQAHAAVWLGDNSSSFEYLALSIPMLLSMGLSGQPFCGVDIGGFDRDCDAELLVRWTQAGSLYPFCRNHSSLLSRRQEPWSFGPEALAICRRWLSLRMRLLPLLSHLFAEAHEQGAPVMRPLFWEHPGDEALLQVGDQFLLGADLLVAPVLVHGARHRSVVLPAGTWTERSSGRRLRGGRAVLAEAPLAEMPLYVRAGALVPGWEPSLSSAHADRGRLLLDLYPEPGLGRSLRLWQDDGLSLPVKGSRWPMELAADAAGHEVTLKLGAPQGPYRSPVRSLVLRFHGLVGRPEAVLVDGKAWSIRKDPGPGVAHGFLFGHSQARLEVPAGTREVRLKGLPGIEKPE